MGNRKAKPLPVPEEEPTVFEEKDGQPPILKPEDPLTDRSWRNVDTCNKELAESLQSDLKEFHTEHRIKNVRLLLLGPVGVGKSSFINSVGSIDAGKISSPVNAGKDASSLTKKLDVYRPGTRIRGFRLIDTMGVEEAEGKGFHVKDAINIIKGHLKPDFRFNPASAADEGSQYFIRDPKIKDKAHCVLFFMDARVLYNDSVSDKTKKKITVLHKDIKETGLKQLLIITHIDCLCPEVKRDLSNTFRSKLVQEAVKQGSSLFGLPEMNVFPVENYHNDVKLDFKKDILLLYALRQAMTFSKDYLRMESQRGGPHESSDED